MIAPPPPPPPSAPRETAGSANCVLSNDKKKLCFFCIGDWGRPSENLRNMANAMNDWAEKGYRPSFILSLGDNFYPSGVSSVYDKLWKTTWQDTFFQYPNLRVPWRAVLGNHDYNRNPNAQIEYTTSKQNVDGLWYLPSEVYKFTELLPDSTKVVDFFAIDTNGPPYHLKKNLPGLDPKFLEYKAWLEEELHKSDAHWKIVYAHHPFYTKGKAHGFQGRCLRATTATHKKKGVFPGYNLEQTFIDGGVHAYFAGHEHVFQTHKAHNIHHFVCGCPRYPGNSRSNYYGGEDESTILDWTDEVATNGFVCVRMDEDLLEVNFVSDKCEIFHSVVIGHPTAVG